jgi:hypothetical protein
MSAAIRNELRDLGSYVLGYLAACAMWGTISEHDAARLLELGQQAATLSEQLEPESR